MIDSDSEVELADVEDKTSNHGHEQVRIACCLKLLKIYKSWKLEGRWKRCGAA